ncbi:hypothetical protein SADUNF_Sadunf04G0022000 [Salix dunnii]|uniref:DUF4408 domain-containing protein n=1 Tax=Salix dunnii TaxID=1413687 RepID=A0A835KA39_9ROSI|nr:hypothetical protein SADUNF_Sadunf04G0022000 [Salix dunnii]
MGRFPKWVSAPNNFHERTIDTESPLSFFFTSDLFPDLLAGADAKSTPQRSGSSSFIESMTQPNLTSPSMEKPLKAVNNEIMDLFDKYGVSIFCPSTIQLAKILTQQQQFTMATAAGSGNGSHTILAKSHRSGSDGIHLPAQSWGSHGYQVPGMAMPITHPQKYMQVELLNANPMYRPGPVAPINSMANTKATTPTQAFPGAPPQPAGYYDLSSLAITKKKGNLLPPTRIHHPSHPQISTLQTPPLSQIQRSIFHIPHFPALSLETNMGSLSLSLKVVLISTSVLVVFLYLKVSVTLVHDFSVNQATLLWSSLTSWLKPPYLYVIINCIIITIVVSSRFHHNTNGTSTYDQIEKIPMEDYVHDMKFRSDGSLHLRALSAYQDREEEEVVIEDKSMVIEDGKNEVADDFVISMSTRVPPIKRIDSSENNLLLLENLSPAGKPLVSSRFGHGKVVEVSHEGGRAMRVARPNEHETLENTWKIITEDHAMPLPGNVKISQTFKDTWENHGSQFSTSLMDPHAVNKSQTFIDRTNYQLPPVGSSAAVFEKFRKEPSLSQDELNQRVEAFINKFKEEMKMQRQTADAKSRPERSGSSSFIESMAQPNLTSPSLEKPLKAVNNDIMDLFDKSSMVSPFSVHQQQLAKMLTQQQQFIMATAAGSGNGSHTILAKSHRSGSDGIHLPAQSWGSHGYQVPGMAMPITHPQKYMQVELLNANPMYRPGPVAPLNGMANTKATTPTQAFPVAPPQPAGYYNLSSLAMCINPHRQIHRQNLVPKAALSSSCNVQCSRTALGGGSSVPSL